MRHRIPVQSGFTLMELLVVMILLAILAGSIGSRLVVDSSAGIRDEANRLAVLLQTTQQQSVLEGRVYAVQFDVNGYRFLALNDKNELETIHDDSLFRQRLWPPNMAVEEIRVEDRPLDRSDAGLVFTPVGDMPLVSITIRQKQFRWRIESHTDGTVTTVSVNA
jgi:general secretion pathway protein H